jgi:hypothetical protein
MQGVLRRNFTQTPGEFHFKVAKFQPPCNMSPKTQLFVKIAHRFTRAACNLFVRLVVHHKGL